MAGSKNDDVPAVAGQDFSFRNRGLLRNWLAVLLTVTLSILIVGTVTPPIRADNLLYDFVVRLMQPERDNRILIIAIDDASLRQLGRWPWDRDVHARMIDRLHAVAPLAIGYDVLFPEPQDDGADRDLARAVADNGRVVLPQVVEIPGPDGAAAYWSPPIAPLATAAAGIGHVVIRPDRDGVVRGIDHLTDVDGRHHPHLADLVVALASGDATALVRAQRMQKPQQQGVPVLAESRDLIVFAGPSGSYPQLSFADVLAGDVPDSLLQDRILLIGATAAGMGDRFSTPMSGTLETMAGIELQANYIDNLLTDTFVRPAPPVVWIGFSLLPVWVLMLSLFFLGPRINIWLGLVLSVAVLGTTIIAFAAFRLWLPPAMALIAIGIIYPLWGWRRLALASRYMLAELRALGVETGLFRRTSAKLPLDPVKRQIALMHAAINDVRDLRRFVSQSLESLPDAAVVADLDGRVVIANEAADALFRTRLPGSLLDQPLESLLHCLDQHADATASEGIGLMSELRQSRIPIDDSLPGASYELQLMDGTSLDVRIVFFTDAGRRPLGWIARFADITWLRASEREREDTLRLLTHDMRAPQASILAVLETEAANLPADVAGRLRRYARQTLTLADNFVHLARAKGGQYAIELFNLSDAVLDAADDLWPLAQRHGIRIQTDVPDDEVLLHGDRALITRAILNLVNNAIKYSGRNTGVQIRLHVVDGRACCAIADEGQGIAAADHDRIFETFSRAAPLADAVQPGASGAGLGLAFVKTVIERHKGEVRLQSEPGRGSVFTIILPLASSSPAPDILPDARTPAMQTDW